VNIRLFLGCLLSAGIAAIAAGGAMLSQMSPAERDRFVSQWQRSAEPELAEISEQMERAKQLSPAQPTERLEQLDRRLDRLDRRLDQLEQKSR
jgi:uncharacterized membrane protein